MSYKRYIVFIAIILGLAALAQVQSGKASYYAKKFSGRQTASGERLHHDSLTCAHRTYPFGTLLKVTNPANGKVVIVRAARELGIIAQGIAPVTVERYDSTAVPFRPEDFIDLPEFDIGTNEGSDTKPIWMELRDQYKKKQKEGE